MERRHFLALTVGALGAAALAAAGVDHDDPALVYRVERHLGLAPGGPDLHLPPSGARMSRGVFPSSYMKADVAWTCSVPPRADPQALVVALYGKEGDQNSVFDGAQLPDAAAYVGAPLAIASANAGPDSYWHRRADGTDAHAMLVEEFVPMLRRRLGPLPLALYGYSMGGFGALLAAERGHAASSANGPAGGVTTGNMFKGVAASSPALWETYAQTAPGAYDDAANFADNDVFTQVPALRSLDCRLDCGTLDPFFAATKALSGLMAWPHDAVFTPGAAHTMSFWRWSAPGQMRFLARACAVM